MWLKLPKDEGHGTTQKDIFIYKILDYYCLKIKIGIVPHYVIVMYPLGFDIEAFEYF